MAAMFGYEPHELTGASIEQLLPEAVPQPARRLSLGYHQGSVRASRWGCGEIFWAEEERRTAAR